MTKIKSFLAHLPIPHSVKVGNYRLSLNTKLKHEFHYFVDLSSVPDQYIIDNFCETGDTVVDVGANIGLTSLFFVNSGAAKVYAIEPVDYLCEKLKSIKCQNIEVINKACSSKEEVLTLYLSSEHDQGHTLNHEYLQKYDWIFRSKKTREVQCVKLDDQLFGGHCPDYIKIDAEGHEIEALKGMKEILNTRPPSTVQLEINSHTELVSIKNYLNPVYRYCYRCFVHKSTKVVYYLNSSSNDCFGSTNLSIFLVSAPIFIFTNKDLSLNPVLIQGINFCTQAQPFLPVNIKFDKGPSLQFSNYASKNYLYKLAYKAYSLYSDIYWNKRKPLLQDLQDDFVGIEIGGGETPSRASLGYKNCDIRNLPSVDVKCHAVDIRSYFCDNSVDIIYARHFLEHLTWEEIDAFFLNCYSLLKQGGRIEMIVPSLGFSILQMIFHRKLSPVFLHGLAGLNGWQRDQKMGGYWDIHKSSFTHGIIQQISQKYGLNLHFLKSQPKEIHFVMSKLF